MAKGPVKKRPAEGRKRVVKRQTTMTPKRKKKAIENLRKGRDRL